MKYALFAVGMAAVLCWIIIGNYPALIYYWCVLMASVSFLHTRKKYQAYRNLSNLIFLGYICFITWVRTRPYKFPGEAEFWINNTEHLFFALVVCLLVVLYITVVFSKKASFGKKLLYSVCIFNFIGLFNEYFQNVINHRALTVLTHDAQKDLLMNVAGSLLFVIVASLYSFSRQRAARKKNSQIV